MALAELLDRLERTETGSSDTRVTPSEATGLQAKPAPMLDRTPVTRVTRIDSAPEMAEGAASIQRDESIADGDSLRIDGSDHWCWPHSEAMNGTEIARFLDRRARLLRWGWAEPEAEKLAERLVNRDRERDDRVSCTDCRHYRPGRCGNHGRAGLSTADLGRDLAAMLQWCPAFAPAETTR